MTDGEYSSGRLLIEGHPDLGPRAVQAFSTTQVAGEDRAAETRWVLEYLGRVITYSSLCRIGRDAGFSRFYSLIDTFRPSDATVSSSRFRRAVIQLGQKHPFLKALVLTQVGHIIMLKTD